jgi:molybdopterin/thiamine biosynthesis adenylyltransferase
MRVGLTWYDATYRVLTRRIAAMKKMAASNVLIVGVQGLGVEIGTLTLTPQN